MSLTGLYRHAKAETGLGKDKTSTSAQARNEKGGWLTIK